VLLALPVHGVVCGKSPLLFAFAEKLAGELLLLSRASSVLALNIVACWPAVLFPLLAQSVLMMTLASAEPLLEFV
jgi:hypothetical protein